MSFIADAIGDYSPEIISNGFNSVSGGISGMVTSLAGQFNLSADTIDLISDGLTAAMGLGILSYGISALGGVANMAMNHPGMAMAIVPMALGALGITTTVNAATPTPVEQTAYHPGMGNGK